VTEDYAWAAGFFDGEGCVSVNRMPSGNYLRLQVASTDLPVLERLQRVIGCGRINGPYQHHPDHKTRAHHKPVWHWRASSDEARAALDLIKPWLSQHSLDKITAAEGRVMTYR